MAAATQLKTRHLTMMGLGSAVGAGLFLGVGLGIQVSGTFGSRQEEAQRLGRLLRPKKDGQEATFYTLVARESIDAEYAMHRQRFLAEQGYAYRLVDEVDL